MTFSLTEKANEKWTHGVWVGSYGCTVPLSNSGITIIRVKELLIDLAQEVPLQVHYTTS